MAEQTVSESTHGVYEERRLLVACMGETDQCCNGSH